MRNSSNSLLLGACHIALVLICGLLSSCLNDDPDIRIATEPSRLVAEGILIDGMKPVVWVGRTFPILERNLSFRIPHDSVQVEIYEDGELFLLLEPMVPEGVENININGIPRSNELYSFDSIVRLRENSVYQLVVSSPSLPTLSSPEFVYQRSLFLENVVMDTLFNDQSPDCFVKQLNVKVASIDANTEAYLELYFPNQDRRSLLGKDGFIVLANTSVGKIAEIEWPDEGARCTIFQQFNVLLFTVPSDYDTFSRISSSSEYDLGGLFSRPQELPHNVQGGYGFFGLGSSVNLPN